MRQIPYFISNMEAAKNMITKPKNFDDDNLSYMKPRLNKRGGKNVNITYNSKQTLWNSYRTKSNKYRGMVTECSQSTHTNKQEHM